LTVQAGFFVVPDTALGATAPAAGTWANAFDLPSNAISDVTRLTDHSRLSSTPKTRGFGSLALETVSAVEAPCLVTSFQQTYGVTRRYAREHVVTCDRSPPAASLEP